MGVQSDCSSDLGRGIFVTSRYNFYVPIESGILLYNSRTGSVLRLSGEDSTEFAHAFCSGIVEIEEEIVTLPLFEQLSKGGFIIPSGTNELETIREQFQQARDNTPIVVTLTTTMDCNLGCYYCYESRTKETLGIKHISDIVTWASQQIHTRKNRSLHVDWYGGEPLLNIEFIDSASDALQSMCLQQRASYSASVISNGTAWPANVGDFIARHKIRQVQVTFDGLPENHNIRRRYRKGYAPSDDTNSFFTIADLVDKLLDHTRVDIRINLDPLNQQDLLPLVDFARERGWFKRKFPAVVQPARLAAYTDRSAFVRNSGLSTSQYDDLRQRLRSQVGKEIKIEESEAPDGFAYPKTSVCAALTRGSFVVGADGLHYRCGLQVGEKHRAVGAIPSVLGNALPNYPDKKWWDQFDPTVLPSCSRCSFLPICWGGCPKKHLDQDAHALDEQSHFWRHNLPRLITSRFGLKPPDNFQYSEIDQFR
jgi:uncharacterized protein